MDVAEMLLQQHLCHIDAVRELPGNSPDSADQRALTIG